MLMSFVSCGGGDSKEFKALKSILDKYDKAIDKAKTCDELKTAYNDYHNSVKEFRNTPKYSGKDQLNYEEKDMMTEEEKDNYTKLWEQVDKKHSEKKKELCK